MLDSNCCSEPVSYVAGEEDGIRDLQKSRGLGDVYKRQHKANGDPSVLNCTQTDTEDDYPILRREVEAAVQSLKKGKSAGVDIPAELVQAGGEDVITALTTILQLDLADRRMANPWTQSIVITLPQKGTCGSARTTEQ